MISKSEKTKISIITPLFHGKTYLSRLSDVINQAADMARRIADVEWVLSNDDPLDPISWDDINNSTDVNVNIVQTEKNHGIQGARVIGLNSSKGDYVLFLDQDDEIAKNWIVSQISSIGQADAVVCDCMFDGVPFYNGWDRPPLAECITKDYIVTKKNGFLPGQVLIRKSSIPQLWKERWLSWNCCDDQYLWICMYANGAVFKGNMDTCYYHNVSADNQSRNLPVRYQSNKEMIDIIREEGVLSNDEIRALEASRDSETIIFLKQHYSLRRKVDVLHRILSFHENNEELSKLLSINVSDKVAVYGADLGVHVSGLLRREGIGVECIVDRNAASLDLPFPTVTIDTIPRSVSVIINTLIAEKDKVNMKLNDMYPGIRVINLDQII